MINEPAIPSARKVELLEATYRYVLENGLARLSLRPLAAAIGSSPRVLVFLFGSKDGLVQAVLARARADELALLDQIGISDDPAADGLATAVEHLWLWLAAPEHQQLLKLWAETYASSLVEPDGVWGGFAAASVHDWLAVLSAHQPPRDRESTQGAARRTLALAMLRGALLDLLATANHERVSAAVDHQLVLLRRGHTATP